MPNTINSLSPNLRDILLNRNIIADSITQNGLTPLLQGIGVPAETESNPVAVQESTDLQADGVFYKDLNAVLNKYQGTDDDYRTVEIVYSQGNFVNSTWAGEPFNHEAYNANVVQLLDYTQGNVPANGPFQGGNIRQFNTARNMYLDATKQEVREFREELIIPTFQTGAYLDENGFVNVGGPSTQPLDIIGSVLTGGGVGFDPNGGGAVANFDVRSSLAGRVLSATGAIEDTKLGTLGSQYLAAAIGNNIAFNLQEETIGRVNTNIRSLLTGGDLIVPNYTVTVPTGQFGKALDLLERMVGFETPASLLDVGSSIFNEENPVSNITRANAMIKNTGKGQILTLFENINANTRINQSKPNGLRQGYAPGFEDERISRGANTTDGINPNIYAFGDVDGQVTDLLNTTDDITIANDASKLNRGYGFDKDPITDKFEGVNDFSWGDDTANKRATEVFGEGFQDRALGDGGADKKSLLYKTKELFKTNNMRTLVSGNGIKSDRSQIQRGVRRLGEPGAGIMSKGSGVLSQDAISGNLDENADPSQVFCRTWTSFDKYDEVGDLVRGTGLNPNARKDSGVDVDSSVLGDNGFVRIGPAKGENIERFMFSIENLAWADNNADLLDCEIGHGDLLTGKKGRIMWFPPYEMSFNETTSTNWDRNNFIGRGEPIYTYNNTERTGTLSWKIIIDHPNYMNYLKGSSDDEIASFFAGCLEVNQIRDAVLTQSEKDKQEVAEASPVKETVDETVNGFEYKLYFKNDSSQVDATYEDGDGDGLGTTTGEGTVGGGKFNYNDNNDFGLNTTSITFNSDSFKGWIDSGFTESFSSFILNECKYCRINITGYASAQGNSQSSTDTNNTNNQTISLKRANSVKDWISTNVLGSDKLGARRFGTIKGEGVTGSGCVEGDSQDKIECKRARYAKIDVVYDPSLKEEEEPSTPQVQGNGEPTPGVSIPVSRFFTECDYFERLAPADGATNGDSFIYDSISQKIKYFHPAFHSITPEGFNSRLNFLEQCMRQGPTRNNAGNPDNMAFGRPPVCILRIGDFYHTKIIIESKTVDYEPLVWDLNPEGVGVQPMIANINISFAFIGGSSLKGPINKLQNAVSFNFFANAELYDPRADRIKVTGSQAIIEAGQGPSKSNDLPDSDQATGVNQQEIVVNQTAEAERENSTEESSQTPETT